MEKVATNYNNEIAYIREGQGFPVILIHGLDGNMASLYSLKDELKHKFEVIVYDVRGHGKSTKKNSFNLEDHVEDLKALMTKLNISSAHLIGHDMGGLIAKHFTDKYESMVATLTLIACNLIDSVHALNKLMIEHQDEIEGFDKSEALILLLPYMYKEQEKAKKWFQNQLIYSRQSAETIEKYHYSFTRLLIHTFNESGHAPHIEEPEHFLDVYSDFIEANEFQKE